MARMLDDTSRTFGEYLLIPRLTRRDQRIDQIDLSAPLSRSYPGSGPGLSINIPIVSACMQAVSGTDLAVALARQGGLSMIFCSQSIDSQVAMVQSVKAHKAGFVPSGANIKPEATLNDLLELMSDSGHSTIPVTEDGSSGGRFVGLITDQDFWEFEDDLTNRVSDHMTPKVDVIFGIEGISLREANKLLHKNKKDCLPILTDDGRLSALVFKKDYVDHQKHPLELLDDSKRLRVGAAINTHDYRERVPALIAAGADALCFDSSDGFSEFQMDGLIWLREQFGEDLVIGGGNVVSAEGFDYLAGSGLVDFIKVGIGGGSICITREQKGVGRGQASALLEVAARRDAYFKETGIYIPICSDGGLANDTQIVMALAMGADFVMMGRYFAMTEESPTAKISINGQMYKPYWGEGTVRAQNWQRYSEGMESRKMMFEEGVDAFVPLVGTVSEALQTTLYKLKSTMMNLGADDLTAFKDQAVITQVSEQSIVEAGTTNVFKFGRNRDLDESD
ncbi:MAG: IMP dehydrogenase [Proteobacteria bacterium]|jgi:IMP dehydrogenase|nr:IMP dehydrogenase [Pseudomonadota bacterium]MDA0956730.1 IMP dehydrogenase [Pseudomonadota bacterium]MDA1206124.1 IMP dehydrogenase [Pseudomonadota bacterium]